jgi:hypothetical protein
MAEVAEAGDAMRSSVLAREARAAPPEPLQGAILIVLDTLRAAARGCRELSVQAARGFTLV